MGQVGWAGRQAGGAGKVSDIKKLSLHCHTSDSLSTQSLLPFSKHSLSVVVVVVVVKFIPCSIQLIVMYMVWSEQHNTTFQGGRGGHIHHLTCHMQAWKSF